MSVLEDLNIKYPYDLTLVRELKYFTNEEGIYNIEMIIQTQGLEKNVIYKFIFANVGDFHFKNLPEISGFKIENISKSGWENIKYEIFDFEDGNLHAYCESIEVVDLTETYTK